MAKKNNSNNKNSKLTEQNKQNVQNNVKDNTKKTENKKIPQSTSDSIPYLNVYKNDIIEVKENWFSKSYKLPDINFKTSTDEMQENLALQYSEFISSFDSGVDIQLTLYNRTVNIEEFKKKVFIDMKPDGLNEYREEYNQVMLNKMTSAKNNLVTDKILTITINALDIFAANEKFLQIDNMISDSMATMTKASVQPMTLLDRLEILHSIYNPDDDRPLYEERKIHGKMVKSFSLDNCAKQGITTKDVIAPSGLKFLDNKGMIGEKLSKSYFVKNYPTWIKGTIFTDFAEIPTNMLVSVYFSPKDQADAIKMVKNQGVNINSKVLDEQKKAIRSGYSYDLISPDLQSAKEESAELLDEITKDNTKLFTTTFLFTLFADTEEDLKGYEEQLKLIANKNLITVQPLTMQQENGFNSTLPLGNNMVEIDRLMTSKTIASIIPFDVQDINQEGGMYYGLNASSKNMILYNRGSAMNSNSCILGMPGAGKSFAAKREMINVLLNTDDEVYVIDPEREYKPLADAFNGAVIKLANGSNAFINPFDLNINNKDDESGGDPVKIKSDFIETICEIMIGGKYGLSPIEKSIIGRSVMNVYEPYIQYLQKTGKSVDISHAPTLKEFYNDLTEQPQMEAQHIALSLERYVKGALDIFSHHTNLDITNRFTVYDIRDIGPGLKELGLQICLDNIWNKMIENQQNGKRTWIYIDEFYLMMQKPSSASYISQLWKRARKWNGYPCAITQNVEDMLKSEDARAVINNCSFLTILGQSPMNKQQLSNMLGISPIEQKYISSAKPGMGLICVNNNIIPMNDDFPTNTKLYKIMTTKADERIL